MSKKKFIAIVPMLLYGCASEQPEIKHELVREEPKTEAIQRRLYDNGQSILCSKPNYYLCFKLTESLCLSETKRYHWECIWSTDTRVGGLKYGKNEPEFVYHYTQCMQEKQLKLYGQESYEILACLRKNESEFQNLEREFFK